MLVSVKVKGSQLSWCIFLESKLQILSAEILERVQRFGVVTNPSGRNLTHK